MRREVQDRLSAAEIADQIAHTRARLSHTLTVVDREYGLRNAVVHGVRMLHMAEADGLGVREIARRHVVPLSLIGAGLAWLTFTGHGGVTARLLHGLAHVQRLGREVLAVAERP
jgi:hypothetical protein